MILCSVKERVRGVADLTAKASKIALLTEFDRDLPIRHAEVVAQTQNPTWIPKDMS